MARPIRIEFEGAVYHVMARGNERREIFRDDHDRHRFLDALAEAVERFGLKIHAYCLMPNHYHLVLVTLRGNLSQAIGWLQVTYTVRFNRRHQRSGHLFQGRFKAQLVEADEYGRWLVEYVHLNPIRSGDKGYLISSERARELAAYEWSSHRDYAGLRRRGPQWLCLDWLRYWGRSQREAQREYRKAIARWFEGPVANPWEQLRGGLILGGEKLYGKAQKLIGEKHGQDEWKWTQSQTAAALREMMRQLVATEADERVKIWARVCLGGEHGADVAREYGYRSGAGVAQLIMRLESAAAHDAALKQKMDRLKGGREE